MSQHAKRLLLHKELGPPVKPEGNEERGAQAGGSTL